MPTAFVVTFIGNCRVVPGSMPAALLKTIVPYGGASVQVALTYATPEVGLLAKTLMKAGEPLIMGVVGSVTDSMKTSSGIETV